jgi:diguanylate cyclase (GGDEF)-like protein
VLISSSFWIQFLQKERRVHLKETLYEMAIISSVIYLGPALVGLIVIVLPTPIGFDSAIIGYLCLLAIVVASVFFMLRNNFPLWLAISHIFIGVPLIGYMIWLGSIPAAAQISLVYLISSTYSFHFLNIYISMLVILLATVIFGDIAYMLAWDDWLLMTVLLLGCSLTLGLVIHLMVKRLHSLATIDGLTGLFNRHAWDTLFEQELSYAKREGHPVTLMIIDLNNFKIINDKKGHLAGDLILQETAKTLKKVMRDSDIIARWGGDEFIVLLRNCNLGQADKLENRLHDKLKGIINFSAGLTDYRKGDSVDTMLERADIAMYLQKKNK